MNLEGWAWSQEMQSYCVEFSPVSGSGWSVIGALNSPVRGGTLGVWRVTSFAPATYNLRIFSRMRRGEYASAPIQVVLGG